MNKVNIISFSAQKAHHTQLQLAKRIILKDRLPKKIRLVAGVDVAYSNGVSIGAAAVLDYDSLSLVEQQTATCKTLIPYIPTLLSFREIHPAVLSIRKLKTQPDLFMVDGQGFAHPYRCGFASHLGLVIGKPTIGVAKSRLIGKVEKTATGDVSFLRDRNEIVGAVISTKQGAKPVYVSVGHMISLSTTVRIVKECTRNNRIPEPLAMAHKIATEEKRKINIRTTVNR
jgi:deoxyribonuclease V